MSNLIGQNRQLCYFIETYGCQMNKYDSEVIAGILESQGFLPAGNESQADILLVNTCAVRKHAEERAMGRVSVLAAWKRMAPHRKLGVIGCIAQNRGETLIREKPYIDFVIGPDQYRLLPSLLFENSNKPRVYIEQNPEHYQDIEPARQKGISGWIAIMRGCNNFCSYCIVPHTRGRESSRSMPDIVREIESMVFQGFKEITLLGQNVNSYHDGTNDFPNLLKQTAHHAPDIRIRFMTSHPKDLSIKLLDTIAATPNLCPHIHLPLQAGSDRILKLMNRNYTQAHYLSLIREARKRIPDVSITTDIMVGFPSETKSEFLDTIDIMKKILFDDAFMYHFSPREGTPAAAMGEQIDHNIRIERLNKIIKLQRDINQQKKTGKINTIVEVLPEAESKKSNNEWIGRTPQNDVLIFPKQESQSGEPVRVCIESIQGSTLRGSIVSPDATQMQGIERRKAC